jgi:hypothetical protein
MRYILSLVLFLVSAPSFAQGAPDPTQFTQLAMRVTEMVDNGQAVAVWDSSSPVMKSVTKRDQFASITSQRRQAHGAIRNRVWEAVIQQTLPQAVQGIPAGRYLTVIFLGTNAQGRGVKEQISFVYDSDNNWRVVGYTISG